MTPCSWKWFASCEGNGRVASMAICQSNRRWDQHNRGILAVQLLHGIKTNLLQLARSELALKALGVREGVLAVGGGRVETRPPGGVGERGRRWLWGRNLSYLRVVIILSVFTSGHGVLIMDHLLASRRM